MRWRSSGKGLSGNQMCFERRRELRVELENVEKSPRRGPSSADLNILEVQFYTRTWTKCNHNLRFYFLCHWIFNFECRVQKRSFLGLLLKNARKAIRSKVSLGLNPVGNKNPDWNHRKFKRHDFTPSSHVCAVKELMSWEKATWVVFTMFGDLHTKSGFCRGEEKNGSFESRFENKTRTGWVTLLF